MHCMRDTPVARLFASLAATVVVMGGATVSSAQTADELFDGRTLHDVRIFMHSGDLALLREHYQDNTYYPADLEWRGVRLHNVAVRSRGFGSRHAVKMALKIDFDRYVTGRRFAGLAALVLDNHLQDPSMIRDFTAMAMFARLGEPATREAFVRVFINDVYQGVYTVVEPVDAAFLDRTVGERDGYLFEFQWLEPFYGNDLGDDLEVYRWWFRPDVRGHEPNVTLYAPIRELFRELSGDDEVLWAERVGRYLDLEQFVTYVAIETCLAEDDGILGFAGMANFYLYRSGESSRHRLIAWDRDKALFAAGTGIFDRVDENLIVRRALARSDLRARYLDTLERCALSALEDDWLVAEIDRLASLIREAAHQDSQKPTSNEEFDASIAFVRDVSARRPAFLLREVEAARLGLR